MKDFTWIYYWLFLIWFSLQLDACSTTTTNKELREIKQELQEMNRDS